MSHLPKPDRAECAGAGGTAIHGHEKSSLRHLIVGEEAEAVPRVEEGDDAMEGQVQGGLGGEGGGEATIEQGGMEGGGEEDQMDVA